MARSTLAYVNGEGLYFGGGENLSQNINLQGGTSPTYTLNQILAKNNLPQLQVTSGQLIFGLVALAIIFILWRNA